MPPSSAISAACCRCTRRSRLRWVSRLFVCLIWFARPFQRGKRNDTTRITEITQSSLSRRLLDVEFVIVPCSSFRLQKKAKPNLAFIFDQRNILCSCSFLAFFFFFFGFAYFYNSALDTDHLSSATLSYTPPQLLKLSNPP